MPLITDIQAQAAFKAFVTGTSHTSALRNWFQEPFEAKPVMYGRDIRAVQPSFAETQVQADSYASANTTIVEKIELKKMTFVPGTNNNALGLYSIPGDAGSSVEGNWVSPFDGSGLGYFPRFYKDAQGTQEITTAFGPTNWFFHAYAGLLIWGGESAQDNWVTAGVTEVYVTLYRYIGPTLESVTSGGVESSYISFGHSMSVPSYGTLFLKQSGIPTSSIPWVPTDNGTLSAISISVDREDLSNSYILEVLINNIVVSGVTILNGTSKEVQVVMVSFNAEDEFQVRLRRINGSGKSNFRNTRAILKLT